MDKNEQNECQCSKAACGCATVATKRCTCGSECRCARKCRCEQSCACIRKDGDEL